MKKNMKKNLKKKWKPETGDAYWYLSFWTTLNAQDITVDRSVYCLAEPYNFNCFRYKKDAIAARKVIVGALKGEQ